MMNSVYPTWLWLAAGLTLFAGGCQTPTPEKSASFERSSETRRLMGVPWTITVYAGTGSAGRAATTAAFVEVERLEKILSDYDSESELSRLTAAAPTVEPVAVSDDLWRALAAAVAWRDRSGGAFDPTVGPLTTLWRQARRSGVMPRGDRLAAARSVVGPDTLVLDRDRRGVSLVQPGMRLDLGGIGMGYAVDRAMEVLAEQGITSAMIDASGDIAVSGPPPGRKAWRIEVAASGGPATKEGRETIELVHAAVTTSGDMFQAVEIDGVRYSHIVDPRTGLGIVGPAAVTVVADDCTTADAVATAASVLGHTEGLAFVESLPECAARFMTGGESDSRVTRSSRWPAQVRQFPH